MKTIQPLIVLKNLEKDALLSRYFAYRETGGETEYALFLNALFLSGAQDNFAAYVGDKILRDENPFSVGCAKKTALSPYLVKAYRRDLASLHALVYENDGNCDFSVGQAGAPFPADRTGEETLGALKAFYEKNGYGIYIDHRAFAWKEGELLPLSSVPSVRLSDLKDYAEEKKTIRGNIENLLRSLPHSDMLLYGERGTGKSSTIHAMLNEYFADGLRIVELSKENMLDLNALRNKLKDVPLKFIVYIDDLSLSGGDERISSLKAALEGSMEGHTDNTMIVATSNRRHIVNEKFSDREDSVHAGDSMQEELSLSDRFGISVLFTTTTKAQYLSIVEQLAADYRLDIEKEKLDALAERWALNKGGRSPRRAKQFIRLAYSCLQKNQPIEF